MLPLVVPSALGALLFFALDSLHVRAGIWSASKHAGVPWWFIFVYFAGIFAVGVMLQRFERRFDLRVSSRALAREIAFFTAVLVAHLFLFRQEGLLALAMVVLLAAHFALAYTPGDLTIAALVIGTDLIAELLLSSAGTFTYAHASVGPLPLWLCPMWGCLGLSIRRFFAYRAYRTSFA